MVNLNSGLGLDFYPRTDTGMGSCAAMASGMGFGAAVAVVSRLCTQPAANAVVYRLYAWLAAGAVAVV